jgi:hypothetical protein
MFSIPKIFESTARFTAGAIAGGLHEPSGARKSES